MPTGLNVEKGRAGTSGFAGMVSSAAAGEAELTSFASTIRRIRGAADGVARDAHLTAAEIDSIARVAAVERH